jgi:hypothetical protein
MRGHFSPATASISRRRFSIKPPLTATGDESCDFEADRCQRDAYDTGRDASGRRLVSIERRADGVIELRPQVAVDYAQAWFWTSRWQTMELQAEADIRQGAVHRATGDEFLALLSAVAGGQPDSPEPVAAEPVAAYVEDASSGAGYATTTSR